MVTPTAIHRCTESMTGRELNHPARPRRFRRHPAVSIRSSGRAWRPRQVGRRNATRKDEVRYSAIQGEDLVGPRRELAAVIGDRPPTWRELQDRIRDFATRFPALCRLAPVGSSRSGQALELLSIKGGPCEVLVIGGPHPNEPVGLATVLALAHQVIAQAELRATATWHILACSDPDGALLNEGWVTATATPTWTSYLRGFYRPALADQPEWTFPCPGFSTPLPETQAMMRIIDAIKPALLLSLHNCDSGDAFYVASRPEAGLAGVLARAADRWGFAVGSSSIDTVGLDSAGPGVFVLNPADGSVPGAATVDRRPHGASSAHYAHRHGGLGLAPEVPMWRTRPHTLTARESADVLDRAAQTLHSVLDRTWKFQVYDSPFMPAVEDTLAGINGVTKLMRQHPDKSSTQDSAFRLPARAAGMLLRDLDIQLGAEHNHPALAEERARLNHEFTAWCREAEAVLCPVAIPLTETVGFQIDTIVSAMRLIG